MKYKSLFIAGLLLALVAVMGIGSTAGAAETEQQSEFVAPIMVVNTSFLNVRTGPGAQFTVLITVVGGTELPVLGIAPDRVWYQVSTIVGMGWINGQFAIPRGDFTNVPSVDGPDSFALVPPGSIDTSGGGGQGGGAIEDDTMTGGVAGVMFGGAREWGVSIVEPHPARTGPTISAGSPGTISANADLIYPLIESVAAEGIVWYRVDDPTFGLVWVESDKSTFRPFGCDFSVVSLLSNVAPRIGPDGSGTLDGSMALAPGTEAYLLDLQLGQYKIELIDGNNGWINQSDGEVREPDTLGLDFCDTGRPAVMDGTAGAGGGASDVPDNSPALDFPTVIVNTGFLNIRSGPGAGFSSVSTVPGGTGLTLLGFAPDGVWYYVQGTFGRGWLNSEFVLLRGDASNLPIIEDLSGATLARPVAVITNAVTLYAAPDVTLGVVGALSGPLEVDIVARTEDATWVQVATDVGFGWVQVVSIGLQGDVSLAPVVAN